MRYIFIPIKHTEQSSDRPADWPFMEQSGKLLDDLPDTWKAASSDDGGKATIISTEYGEFLNAKTDMQKMKALVRLASACLFMWRSLYGRRKS